jgi:hypothetical protein
VVLNKVVNKFSYIFLFLLLLSCRREEDAALKDLGYAYFPLDVGKYVVYSVREIDVDAPVSRYDTSRYFIKEKLESVFIDNSGKPSIRVERYRKNLLSDPWVISDVWYFFRDERNAQKVEENERYIRMSFPITEDARWNGNAFLPVPDWMYKYEDIHQPYSAAGLTFDKTVTVNQRFRFNFVEYENCKETYAENVGMVFRQYIVTSITGQDSTNIQRGKILHQYAIEHGVE